MLGYLILSIPIIIILYVVFLSEVETEKFIDFEGIGKRIIDKFETSIFSPELNKIGVDAGIIKSEPQDAAPVVLEKPEDIPSATNITNPDVCDETVMECTGTKEVIGKPKMNPFNQKPYGDVPIGQLDYTGFRDLKKDLSILKGQPKSLPGGKFTSECKFVGNGEKCPEGFNLVGASIGISGSGAKLQCNVTPIDIPAVLSAEIVNGEIKRIIPINGGRGHVSNPAVVVVGTGQGAKARAFANDKGVIEVVEILDGGIGYDGETTTIKVDQTIDSDTCQLCCRK